MPTKKKISVVVDTNYPTVRDTMKSHFGIVLTDEQIVRFSSKHPVTKRDTRDDVCDTIDRDFLIDAIATELLGEGAHWPMNMDSEDYAAQFYQDFHDACMEQGIEIDPKKWYKE